MQDIAEYLWMAWLILAAVFAVAEISTVSFIALWFGIGAGAAALVAALGFSLPIQLLTFVGASTALTLSTRRIFLRWLNQSTAPVSPPDEVGLIGKRGLVVTGSRGSRSAAEVELDGTVWTALPVTGDQLTLGEECEVVRIEGNQLHVRPVQQTPDWKALKQTNERQVS
ncbi:MAG: NfeD family protein [Chloracidobacterium sp.]|uniref:NfeD family protein n=1 Tax=Chloracidobacterium validum TaxID=2821543 RepID=A0ABX8B4U1_9BACT|nr:NfeD family protein [Chloracidobacterium validum]QUW01938.1 NfeD family protein [Chloracidobacterium validum]